MYKILIYGEITWSVGKVHKSISEYLKNDFEFTFYDWSKIYPIDLIPILINYDIVLTNLVTLNIFKRYVSSLKNFIFIAHGYPDVIGYKNDFNLKLEDFSTESLFAVTSNSIKCLFPKEIILKNLFNGVDLKKYDRQQSNTVIKKIGWCGAPEIISKRVDWIFEITNKSDTLLSIASTIPTDQLYQWYKNIDVLVITAGPDEWMETGPLPAFEAIATGKLVIGTKVGNFAKFPGPKFSTMEEAIFLIKYLQIHSDEVEQIIKEQYKYLKENFSYEILHLQWKEVFLECLKNNNHSI